MPICGYFNSMFECADEKVKVLLYWTPIKVHYGICANGPKCFVDLKERNIFINHTDTFDRFTASLRGHCTPGQFCGILLHIGYKYYLFLIGNILKNLTAALEFY